ncbi:hypothetical protein G9Q86_26630 [Pseudomonas sp. CCUG 57209]|nr:type VI secretion system tube protein Hcp [Pseudomonas sivasensis]MBA2932122.1 hypothetical protein [Pseudomonas sivasensis]
MAVDMFLKLGDIKGESQDLAHRDEIDITNWGWGLSQTGSMHSGTGGGSGKADFTNLNLTKPLDKSSPNLMMACATGKHYPEAKLVVRKAGGTSPVEYLVITLKEVMVLYDSITLSFATVDGFNIHVGAPDDFARFTDQVLPLLRERGLFRSEYSHSTLRGHLGLPVPVNRHTAARSEAA